MLLSEHFIYEYILVNTDDGGEEAWVSWQEISEDKLKPGEYKYADQRTCHWGSISVRKTLKITQK